MLRALFLCLAIAVLGETILQAAAALAVSALSRTGIAAATNALGDATERAQSAIAIAVAQGATPPVLVPSPAPTCVLANDTGCSIVAAESIVLATPDPTSCPMQGCAGYEQGNDAVGEGRFVATISATASNAQGVPIATRTRSVIFRTLHVPPYAVPGGALDATLDDSESGAGDLGGMTPLDSSSGTLVDVVYQNATSGAVMPANVWMGLAPSAPATSSWSP